MPATLTLDSQSTGQDLLREWRVRSLYSPYFFIKNVLRKPLLAEHIHGKDLKMVLRKMHEGVTHQAIEYPRGFLKTTVYTMGLSIWLVLPKDPNDKDLAMELAKRNPAERIKEEIWDWREDLRDQDYTQLIVFETVPNAERKLGEIQRVFDENDTFRAMFPEIVWPGAPPHKEAPSWNNECLIIPRVGRNRGIGEGTFEAKGVGSAIQSTHYDIVWADDLYGERARKSEIVREDTKEYYGRLVGIEQPTGTRHFMVSNRWGFDDLNAFARTQTRANGEPFWNFYTRKAYELDEAGMPVCAWPEVYDYDRLMDKKALLATEADFFSQYLNDPRPPGEREIEAARIHRYKVHRSLEIECSCGARHHPETLNRYLLFDPYNAKGNTRSKSCPGIAVVGLAHDKHVFLLEAFQKKNITQSGLIEKCFEFNDRWKVLKLVYEDVGAQNMWELVLRKEQQSQEFKDAKHKPIRSIAAVGVKNKPLDVRVRDYLVPVLEARPGVGTFAVREGHTLLFDMLDTFPHSVPGHDYDLLSALAMGPLVWQFPYAQEEEARFQIEEDDYLEHFNQPYSRVAQ